MKYHHVVKNEKEENNGDNYPKKSTKMKLKGTCGETISISDNYPLISMKLMLFLTTFLLSFI